MDIKILAIAGIFMFCLGIGAGYMLVGQRMPDVSTATRIGNGGDSPGTAEVSNEINWKQKTAQGDMETADIADKYRNAQSRIGALEQQIGELNQSLSEKEQLIDEFIKATSEEAAETSPYFPANYLEPRYLKSIIPAHVEAHINMLVSDLELSEEQQEKLRGILIGKAENELDAATPLFDLFKDEKFRVIRHDAKDGASLDNHVDLEKKTKEFEVQFKEKMVPIQYAFEQAVSMLLNGDQLEKWRKLEIDNARESVKGMVENKLVEVEAVVPALNDYQRAELKRVFDETYRFEDSDVKLGERNSFGQEVKDVFTTGYGFSEREILLQEKISKILTREQIDKLREHEKLMRRGR